MSRVVALAAAAKALRSLADAEAAVSKRSAARAALSIGSPRARVTTANARWATACEERDRRIVAAAEAIGALGFYGFSQVLDGERRARDTDGHSDHARYHQRLAREAKRLGRGSDDGHDGYTG